MIFRHFRLILTPRKEVIHSNFKAYEISGDGKEKTVHLGKSRNKIPDQLGAQRKRRYYDTSLITYRS